MNESQVKALLLFINAGTKVLSARVLLFVTLFLTFSLFCWALYLPGYERITTAVAFAVLVFLPVIRVDQKSNQAGNIIEGE
jgi:hypothetical protein